MLFLCPAFGRINSYSNSQYSFIGLVKRHFAKMSSCSHFESCDGNSRPSIPKSSADCCRSTYSFFCYSSAVLFLFYCDYSVIRWVPQHPQTLMLAEHCPNCQSPHSLHEPTQTQILPLWATSCGICLLRIFMDLAH